MWNYCKQKKINFNHFCSHIDDANEVDVNQFLGGPQQRYISKYEMLAVEIIDSRLNNVLI